jgi:hypothetical protein
VVSFKFELLFAVKQNKPISSNHARFIASFAGGVQASLYHPFHTRQHKGLSKEELHMSTETG